MAEEAKRVFISYAWESETYRQWVEKLAVRLRDDGVDARLDAWHLEADGNIPEFMRREVRHADQVLILCSPGYRAKAHALEDGNRISGVGWETRLVTGRLFVGHELKMLAVLARGTWKESAPGFLAGQLYADLTNPEKFESQYLELLRRITGSGKTAPSLGSPPADLRPEPVKALRGTDSASWADESPAGDKHKASTEEDGDVEMRFELRGDGSGGWSVQLRVDGDDPVVAPFTFDPEPHSQLAKELRAITENTCTADEIQNLGCELWSRLLGGSVEEAFDEARRRYRERPGAVLQLRMVLPPELEDLPWEAAWDFDELALATSPTASLVRSPEAFERSVAPSPSDAGSVRMLVVIPSGSSLRTSSEWEKIRLSARAAGETVVLETLDGRVTRERLAEALREDWDILHFIGHGRLDEQGRVELRFNAPSDAASAEEEEDWISSRLFAQQLRRSPTRLVVLNCCHAGSLEPQGLSGLSTYLAKARVPAVLAMRHAVGDSVAADFSSAFYRELFTGRSPGRVDLAVQEGRAALERNYTHTDRARSYITPVLYLAPGHGRLFELRAIDGAPTASTVPAMVGIDERIDRRLVHAVAGHCCLPILGPGILTVGAERDAPRPPGPEALLQRVAERCRFPDSERITPLAESGAAWLTPFLFERVCQYFESVSEGERRALNEEIGEAYRPFEPHDVLHRIAGWQVPGMVYTHVDGLLEQALEGHRGRNLRVVQAEELRPGAAPGSAEILLVNLRGSFTAPSMILTEEDEDRILDRMAAISAFVADLMNRVGGCTLLFLGVSPRDALVRALARRLLRDDVARNRGTAFFADDQISPADRSYWQQFKKLEWLELDAESLITGLSAAVRSGVSGS